LENVPYGYYGVAGSKRLLYYVARRRLSRVVPETTRYIGAVCTSMQGCEPLQPFRLPETPQPASENSNCESDIDEG